MSLSYLWKRLSSLGVDVPSLWSSIVALVLKSLVCVDDKIPYQPNSFEVRTRIFTTHLSAGRCLPACWLAGLLPG